MTNAANSITPFPVAMNAGLPSDPKVIKKMEKAIEKEAQADEKDYKRALKELRRTEKSEAEAFKAAGQAGKHLKRMEDREHETIKSLQKATHKHDRAVTDLHSAQGDVQIQKQRAQRLRNNASELKVRADELLRVKQTRDEQRGQRLADLHPHDRRP